MKVILLFVFSLFFFHTYAQGGSDEQLAQHYYSKGEFDKAVTYYEKLYNQSPTKINFDRYYDCLLQVKDYKEAEKVLKKESTLKKNDIEFQILMAEFYELTDNSSKSIKIYEKIIDDLPTNNKTIINTFDVLLNHNKNDYAYQVLVKGRKLLKKDYPLNLQFAAYYAVIANKEKMLEEYFDLLKNAPYFINTVQTRLSSVMNVTDRFSEDYELLRVYFLKEIQAHPNDDTNQEMLSWLFISGGNYAGALQQEIALDKRNDDDGEGVYELAEKCIELNELGVAKKGFQYVIGLGKEKRLYFGATRGLLNVLYKEVIKAFDDVISTFGARTIIEVLLEKTHIQAFYANQIPEAIQTLEASLNLGGLTDMQRAEIKMKLADVLVLKGDIWEASLYYMQIDKDFKFEPIGHEAKFKNARVYYYDGEFEFAQSQLSVLKESTSKLIANNAMELSLLITENYGLDSNYQAMFWFASAELLIERHLYEEAFILFDSITTTFPYQSLSDEILLKKAKVRLEQERWLESIDYLEKIIKYHNEDILADDALYMLGLIYEEHLKDTAKALEYYKKIMFEHKGSLYVTEARNHFRKLRGDIKEVEQ
jgi:tetratricopeptide (TPR) repeat protein